MFSARPVNLLLCGFFLLQPALANAQDNTSIRFASFNISMGLESEGELYERLVSGEDENLKKVAAIIQTVNPDVILLNEFDRFELDSGVLFINNYLDKPQYGNEPVSYLHTLDGAVNTGEESGLDLNSNGVMAEPQDAWGFGTFKGQYGMLVLSRFPLRLERSFRYFKWKDMPGAMVPVNPDGSPWYPDEIYKQLRLSSKNHWDVAVDVGGQTIHFLVSHPTPPVFDGPEDYNGTRNHDEIRLWADYINPEKSAYIHDDTGLPGGLPGNAHFVIAGDMNADPVDGDSSNAAISQLLQHPRIDASCEPVSKGAVEASRIQGGINLEHRGNPAADTADFSDKHTGNLRIDYVLPSATLKVTGCGVFWPATGKPGHVLIDVSDHRMVWVDITY
jgi:endonuclease/exonuclease/phosphatase family metal-dependent hydrolase